MNAVWQTVCQATWRNCGPLMWSTKLGLRRKQSGRGQRMGTARIVGHEECLGVGVGVGGLRGQRHHVAQAASHLAAASEGLG
jgi:hypothetical protein